MLSVDDASMMEIVSFVTQSMPRPFPNFFYCRVFIIFSASNTCISLRIFLITAYNRHGLVPFTLICAADRPLRNPFFVSLFGDEISVSAGSVFNKDVFHEKRRPVVLSSPTLSCLH